MFLCHSCEWRVIGLWVGSPFWRRREKRADLSRGPVCLVFSSSTKLHGHGLAPGSLSTQEPDGSIAGGHMTAGREKGRFGQKNG